MARSKSKGSSNESNTQALQHGGSTGNISNSQSQESTNPTGAQTGEIQALPQQTRVLREHAGSPTYSQNPIFQENFVSKEAQEFQQNVLKEQAQGPAFFSNVQNELGQVRQNFEGFSHYISEQLTRVQQENQRSQEENRRVQQQTQKAQQEAYEQNNKTFQLISDQFAQMNFRSDELKRDFQGAVGRLDRKIDQRFQQKFANSDGASRNSQEGSSGPPRGYQNVQMSNRGPPYFKGNSLKQNQNIPLVSERPVDGQNLAEAQPRPPYRKAPRDYLSSDPESGTDSDSTMEDATMDDQHPLRTKYKPTAVPEQVIQMQDLPPMQPTEDLHTYIQLFENSYCGAIVDDQEKIYKLVNKLRLVPDIWKYAFKMSHRTHWPMFRNKLLREKGKKQSSIMQEYRRTRLDRGEDICDFVDRLVNLLTQPAAGFREKEIIRMVWGKVPWYIQDEVVVYGKGSLRSLGQFRRAISKIHNDPTRKQIRDLDRKYDELEKNLRTSNTGRRPQDENKGGAPFRRTTEESRNTGSTKKVPEERSRDKPRDPEKDKNFQARKAGGKNFYAEDVSENEQEELSSPNGNNSEVEDVEAYAFSQMETIQEERTPSAQILANQEGSEPLNKDRIQKRRALQKQDQEKIRKILQDETLGSLSNLDNFDTVDNQEKAPMDLGQTMNFEEIAQRQPNKSEVDRQILNNRQEQSNGRNFTIEDDVFFDGNGLYDLTSAESSIFQKVSLRQLRIWRELQTKGHSVIYHAEEEPHEQVETFFHQIQEQGVLQSEILRVKGRGEHLYLTIRLEDHEVQAIVDTGAQRTLISESLARRAGLEDRLTNNKTPYSLKGIAGGVRIISYLPEVQVHFNDLTVLANVPVVSDCSFDMLLGQDIIRSLNNCQMNFSKLVLTYDVQQQDTEPQERVMPLQLKTKRQEESVFLLEEEEQFPSIHKVQGPYDLALIDPPMAAPRFHTSEIPYQAYSPEDLKDLGKVLNRIMAKNCIILVWCSGKSIPDTLSLLSAWGFDFLNFLLVWVKLTQKANLKMGLGYWTRNNAEFLIMAKKGLHARFRSNNRNVSQTMLTLMDQPEIRRHSSKPVKIYDILSQVFDLSSMRSIELFARVKESPVQKQYFDLYGDEIEGFFQAVTLESFSPEILYSVSLSTPTPPRPTPFIHSDDQSLFDEFIQNLDMPEALKQDREITSLLGQHFNVFDCKGQTAKINHVQFRVKVRPNAIIPETKVMKFDREREQFLKEWIKASVEKDYVERGKVRCAFSPVVVNKKGPAKFRACVNFQPLNEVLEFDPELHLYNGDDAESILIHGAQAKVMCSLDCKEAHNGLEVPEEDRENLGILIPGDGVYRSKRGQFGILTVSKAFIKAMHLSIGWLRDHGVFFYADDIIIFGKNHEHCLWLLGEVLRCLERDGFIISARKCRFFKSSLEVLGQQVGDGEVSISQNKVAAIQQIEVPRTKKQLQKFIGCLTYIRKFLPNLASLLTPLYDACKGSDFLSLNALQLDVFHQLKSYLTSNQILKLPEFHKPFFITISFNPLGYGAALFQKVEGTFRPIFYRSKTLHSSSPRPQYLLQLEALAQALKDWKQVLYNREIRVLTDSPLLKHALSFKGDDVQINRFLMKIHAYNPKVDVKPESFKALRFSQLLVDENTSQSHIRLEDLLAEHEKDRFPQKLKRTSLERQEISLQLERYDYHIYFDGACTRQRSTGPMGSYAFVVFDREGQKIHEEAARVQSNSRATNNLSESYAALRAIQYIQQQNFDPLTSILLIGDSELVVRQIKGQYRINSDPLRIIYRQIKQILRTFKKVTLRNVPREYNEIANELAQSTLKQEVAKELESLSFQVFAIYQPDAHDLLICQACGKKDNEEDMYICDSCGQGQHLHCLGELASPTGGSFYCRYCEHYVFNNSDFEKGDVTQDHVFLDYLSNPNSKIRKADRDRCQQLAQFYFLKDNELFFFDVDGTKRVPPVGERHLLLLNIHQGLGHCGVANTVRITKQSYFWPGLLGDVERLISSCILCQARRRSYLPMPQVFPTYKGLSPWQFISLDLIEIRNEKPDSHLETSQDVKFVLSTICAFSKAPELVPLPDKSAATIRQAFIDQVVCRYGCPLVVRSDDGSEFKGAFGEYLLAARIKHIQTGPRYPQGNGLVERINRTIKEKLQALYNSEEYSEEWLNLIQTVAFSIRLMRSRSTGFSPFQLMYGRDPLLPGHFPPLQEDTFFEPSTQYITSFMEKTRQVMQNLTVRVKGELAAMNKEIKTTVEAREFKSLTNLQFGQPIFVRFMDHSTKLALESEGPCFFIRYWNDKRRDLIVYYQPSSKRYKTSPICNVKLCDLH